MECLLPYLCMVTVPHIMVGLERMLDYRGVGLERFHCISSQLDSPSLPHITFSNTDRYHIKSSFARINPSSHGKRMVL